MKKYIELKEKTRNATHLKIEVYYNKGGMNYFTYKDEKRGYYIAVSPVEKSGNLESFIAFSGIKQLITEVKRQSEKAYLQAISEGEKLEKNLIDYVCTKNNIEVKQYEMV